MRNAAAAGLLIAVALTRAYGSEIELVAPETVATPLINPAAAAVLPEAEAVSPALAEFLSAPVSGAAILERAAAFGVPLSAIGQAIQASASLPEASAGLQRLGLIKSAELRFDTPANVEASRGVLQTLWHEAGPAAAGPTIDLSLPVPALVAVKDGIEYHIHGVAHGQGVPPGGARVRGLVRALADRRAALYTEQNLPSLYGYRYGIETLDHAVKSGGPLRLRELGGSRVQPKGVELLKKLAGLLSMSPDQAGLSLFSVRAELARLARDAWAAGLADVALYWSRLRALYTGRSDVRDLLRLELPMPIKYSEQTTLARSRAMAEAISADARARGLTKVHVLTGINHADEIAYFLRSVVPGQ